MAGLRLRLDSELIRTLSTDELMTYIRTGALAPPSPRGPMVLFKRVYDDACIICTEAVDASTNAWCSSCLEFLPTTPPGAECPVCSRVVESGEGAWCPHCERAAPGSQSGIHLCCWKRWKHRCPICRGSVAFEPSPK